MSKPPEGSSTRERSEMPTTLRTILVIVGAAVFMTGVFDGTSVTDTILHAVGGGSAILVAIYAKLPALTPVEQAYAARRNQGLGVVAWMAFMGFALVVPMGTHDRIMMVALAIIGFSSVLATLDRDKGTIAMGVREIFRDYRFPAPSLEPIAVRALQS